MSHNFIFVRHNFVLIKLILFTANFYGRSAYILALPPRQNDNPMIGPLLQIYKTLIHFRALVSLFEKVASTIYFTM